MFGPGDIVRHVLNDEVVGIVINQLDFGARYEVRLEDMSTHLFIVEEIELVDGESSTGVVIDFCEAASRVRGAGHA